MGRKLLQSVREMNAGKAARVTRVELTEVGEARHDPLELVAFDAAKYLDNDEALAEYMTAVREANDPDLLLVALRDVACATR